MFRPRHHGQTQDVEGKFAIGGGRNSLRRLRALEIEHGVEVFDWRLSWRNRSCVRTTMRSAYRHFEPLICNKPAPNGTLIATKARQLLATKPKKMMVAIPTAPHHQAK